MISTTSKRVAVVVIPTYNESFTISDLLEYLFLKIFPTIDQWNCKVLIVDGNSPDKTSSIVKEKQKTYQNLFLLQETEKEGLGSAYLKGFKAGMEDLDADVFIQFDVDFQHPPDIIPAMLQKIDDGTDFVLCSRRIKGGSITKGWGLKRLLYSVLGRFIARILLFFPTKNFFKITDPTSVLRALRVKGFVDRFDEELHYSKSFGGNIEFLYRMIKLNASVTELPLQFRFRTKGESKIEYQIPKDIFKTAFLVRWNDPVTKRFIKFGVVGFTGYIINAIALELFRHTNITYNIAHFFYRFPNVTRFPLVTSRSAWSAGLAAELAIISNYLLNNFWTFLSYKIKSPLRFISKMFQFNLTSFGGIVIQFFVIGFATNIFGDTPLVRGIALVFAVVVLIIPYNWTIYNWLIWRVKSMRDVSKTRM
jgi:dolichol-phosphate mannosyltransferase